MTILPLTTITLPEIALRTRDAHKLRGYFGDFFREHSPLLHNHFEDGTFRHAYPLVQYKVLGHTPTLVGLGEGADLLVQLFLRINQLDIDGVRYEVQAKNIRHQQAAVGWSEGLHRYRFETLWMPLNQRNYAEHLTLGDEDRYRQLSRILRNNLIAFLKGVDAYSTETPRILSNLSLSDRPVQTQFKNQSMLAFLGEFVANVELPDGIGLGKSVARGFGTVRRIG
jgi:hypothetical protein